MVPTNYRVDSQTGAVIFKKSAGKQKAQQMEQNIKMLSRKVKTLEEQNTLLLELLLDKNVLTYEEVQSFKELPSHSSV